MIDILIFYAKNESHTPEEVTLEFMNVTQLPGVDMDKAWSALKNTRPDAYDYAKVFFFKSFAQNPLVTDNEVFAALCETILSVSAKKKELLDILKSERLTLYTKIAKDIQKNLTFKEFTDLCLDSNVTDHTIEQTFYYIAEQDGADFQPYLDIIRSYRETLFQLILEKCKKPQPPHD